MIYTHKDEYLGLVVGVVMVERSGLEQYAVIVNGVVQCYVWSSNLAITKAKTILYKTRLAA
jgi:hypothetical protein